MHREPKSRNLIKRYIIGLSKQLKTNTAAITSEIAFSSIVVAYCMSVKLIEWLSLNVGQ